MTTKLTLSVPVEAVEKAKRYAKAHDTSVSALFTSVIENLPDDNEKLDDLIELWPSMKPFVGLVSEVKAFDARSEGILKKHG